MPAIQQALITFFEQVATKDRALLKKLKHEACFRVEKTGWYFTLPDLYTFLHHHDDSFRHIDYKPFRQLIFNSLINQAVKSYGAEITIADNRNKVDKSIYVLVWQAAE